MERLVTMFTVLNQTNPVHTITPHYFQFSLMLSSQAASSFRFSDYSFMRIFHIPMRVNTSHLCGKLRSVRFQMGFTTNLQPLETQ
jgi:hypothetical protein